jgi:outer membrane protein assembly factor BamB
MRNLVIILAVFMAFCSCNNKSEFSQWRGENRNGIFNETNLLTSWPNEGPALLWEFEGVGNGYGSPAITSDRIYIQGEIDSIGHLFTFDLQGNLFWKKPYAKEWTLTFPGSRACPTVVDDLIYVTSGLGNLSCFSAKEARQLWSVDLKEDFNGSFTMHGHSEAPLIAGDKIFLVPGGEDHNVVALNRFDGKLIWSCKGLGERPGYNAPYLIELDNRDILVTFTAYALLGIDIEDGKLLWTHIQDNIPVDKRALGMGDTHSNTVLYDNGYIYYVAGDGNCAVKLKLSDDGSQITEVWRNKQVDDYMGGIVKLGNYIYTGTTAKKSLVSVNIENGLITDSLSIGSGNTIYADGNLYYYTQSGKVNLVKPQDGKLELISSFKITKGTREHFAHPVIKNGILYIRHGNALMAYDIKNKD